MGHSEGYPAARAVARKIGADWESSSPQRKLSRLRPEAIASFDALATNHLMTKLATEGARLLFRCGQGLIMVSVGKHTIDRFKAVGLPLSLR